MAPGRRGVRRLPGTPTSGRGGNRRWVLRAIIFGISSPSRSMTTAWSSGTTPRALRAVAAGLALPETTVARYDGSFLQLRHEIDPLLNGLHPPRLVVYVPMDQAGHRPRPDRAGSGGRRHAARPAAARPQHPALPRRPQRPASRSSATINAAEIEKQVEAGKLSPGRPGRPRRARARSLDGRPLAHLRHRPTRRRSPWPSSHGDRHDAEVEKKTAQSELADLLRPTFDIDLPADAHAPRAAGPPGPPRPADRPRGRSGQARARRPCPR